MVWFETLVGGSLNPKWGRNGYSAWWIINLFEFMMLEEWLIGIYGAGMPDLGPRFGQVRCVD